MHYYTAAEAQKPAEYISNFYKVNEYSLIIFNGPRTGGHNPQTGEKDLSAHITDKLDNVT